MAVTFFSAKNGQTICRANGLALHSAYNPDKEAERFAAALDAPFSPHYIVVTEPALSYCAPHIKKRFPKATLCAVRYSRSFLQFDKNWDIVFYTDGAEKLGNALFNKFGEEGICDALFFSWRVSGAAFPDENKKAWREIEGAVKKSRDILFTRSRFSARWILNAFSFCTRVSRVAFITRGASPVVIAASGPSLEAALPFLKKRRASFFLLAVSSALSALLANGIAPDVCISTDGGFYAKAHLRAAYSQKIPLALSPESAADGAFFKSAAIVPLSYGDGVSAKLMETCGIRAMPAERNGTVSGTALALAQSVSAESVIFCGLDLAASAGLQHARPNALDAAAESSDARTATAETRNVASRFSSGALALYRTWFSSLSQARTQNVCRLAAGDSRMEPLGKIRDIDSRLFEKILDEGGRAGKKDFPRFLPAALPDFQKRRTAAIDFFQKNAGSEAWLREIFPAETLAFFHANENERQKAKDRLDEKNARLCKKIARLLNC